MVKCSFVLLIAGFGVSILLITWNMVYIYRDFNHRRFIEKVPNNKNADMNLSHQTGKVSKHAMRIAMFYLRKLYNYITSNY